MKVKVSLSQVRFFATPWTIVWTIDSLGKNTGVVCHSFLQWTRFCYSFTQLCKPFYQDKAVIHVIILVIFL